MILKKKTLQDPEGRFADIIEPVTTSYGCRLVQVRIGGSQASKGNALEIFIENQDGAPLQMDVCTKISREISAIMDVEDRIENAYMLEVGSPGLDRPLTLIEDFIRFKGYEAKLEFKMPMSDGQKRIRGLVTQADENGFTLVDEQKRSFDVLMSDLSSARLIASDELLKAIQNGQFPKPINTTTDTPTNTTMQMEA